MKVWEMFDLNFIKYSNDDLKGLIEEIQKRILDLDVTIDKKKYGEFPFDDIDYPYSSGIKIYEQIQIYLRAYIDVIASELKDREKRICNDCKKWGTKKCPNSSKCYVLDAKPYFVKKKEKTIWEIIKEKLVNLLH